MKTILKTLIAGMMLLSATALNAEGNISKSETEIEKRVAAAKDLLIKMDFKKTYEETIRRITDDLIKRNQKLASIKDKILAFYNKYIGWDAIKDDQARIYAKYFSAKELQDIGAFYDTETGKKSLKLMPDIMMEGRALAQRKLKSHIGELAKLIQEALKLENNSTAGR